MYLSGVQGMGSAATDAFDKTRQQLWEEYLQLERNTAGQLTAAQLTSAMQQLQSIMERHRIAFNKASLAGASSSWLEPRFNDYQNVYANKMTSWQAMAGAVAGSGPAAPSISVTGAPTIVLPTDTSQHTQLVISAPAGSAAAGGGAAPLVTGGGSWGGDAFAPAYSGQQGAAAGGFGDYLPFVAGGLALAFLLRR